MKDYMIRPIVYKCVSRAALAVTALLLWNRFFGKSSHLALLGDGCFSAGIFFLCMAWFSYLRLDGVRINRLFDKVQRKKKPRRGNSDIVDFADEHIVSFDEIDDRERSLCSLAANLICAGGFLLVWIVF